MIPKPNTVCLSATEHGWYVAYYDSDSLACTARWYDGRMATALHEAVEYAKQLAHHHFHDSREWTELR